MTTSSEEKQQWLNIELNRLAASGMNKAEIARKLGVSSQTLNNVLHRDNSVSDKFIDKFVGAFGLDMPIVAQNNHAEQAHLVNANDVLNRAKALLSFKTDASLASYLGIRNSVLSTWRGRNVIAGWENFFNKMHQYDLNWLVLGKQGELAANHDDVVNLQMEIERLKKQNETLLEIIRNLSART